jgi:hypothetical protein
LDTILQSGEGLTMVPIQTQVRDHDDPASERDRAIMVGNPITHDASP